MPMKKITPILTVDAIEAVLPFWTQGLGFQTTVTVPHPPDDESGPLGFAILVRDGVEVMLQTRASVEADLGASAAPGYEDLGERMAQSLTTLFVEVDALDPILEGLEEPEVAIPRRRTFYGMDEIFLLAPGGVLLGLAAPVADG